MIKSFFPLKSSINKLEEFLIKKNLDDLLDLPFDVSRNCFFEEMRESFPPDDRCSERRERDRKKQQYQHTYLDKAYKQKNRGYNSIVVVWIDKER